MADTGPNDWLDQAPPPPAGATAGPNDWLAPAGAAPADSKLGYGDAIQAGIVQGTPFGKSLATAAETYLPRALSGAPAEATSDYNQNYARISEQIAAAQRAYPKTTFASSMLPSLASPGGIAKQALYQGAVGLNDTGDQPFWDDPLSAVGHAAEGAGFSAIGSKIGQAIVPYASAGRDAVLQAGKNLGVSIPRYIASEHPDIQRMGQFFRSFPMTSGPINAATGHSIEQMGEAAATTAGAATPQTAGQAMGSGLRDWIGPVSKGDVNAKYNAVTQALTNPNAMTPLSATAQTAQGIFARRSAAGLGDSAAVNQVSDALSRPNGLTYSGIKDLRTSVGEMMNSSMLPANISGSELGQLYGSLSQDLQRAAYTAGGQSGVAAHNAANDFAAATATRREQLVKFLGGQAGNASDEAVFTALQRASAAKGGSADINRLNLAKASVPQSNWDELGQGMVSQLGRDSPSAPFSPAKFLTDYGKISPDAKDALFGGSQSGSVLRKNLDDLQTLGTQYKAAGTAANPSGTGHVLGGMAALETLLHGIHHPIRTGAAVIGGASLSNYLANPATSGAVNGWLRATNPDAARFASQRLASAASAQFGASLDPGALTALALHPVLEHFQPEDVGTSPGTMP